MRAQLWTRRHSRRQMMAGVGSVALLGLVGCGDDDGGAEEPTAALPKASVDPATSSPTATAAATGTRATATAVGSPASLAPYYPPVSGEWERADPAKNGWSAAGLEKLVAIVKENESATFMMLTQGRILVEQYFGPVTAATPNDVASVQKSVTSTLLGMAREKKLLTLDDSVSKYLAPGWSKATPAEESVITLRHLMTHSSGLDPRTLKKTSAPGAKFDYNTDAYQKLRPVLEKATGTAIAPLTKSWLFDPIGGAATVDWRDRGEKDATGAIQYGLTLTARDMARFGLLSLRRGRWQANQLIQAAWYDEAWAPSKVSKEYGLLWWLMAARRGKTLKNAPADWVAALGAKDQKIYVIPSLDLVVTRQGLAAGEETESSSSFDDVLFKAIAAARA